MINSAFYEKQNTVPAICNVRNLLRLQGAAQYRFSEIKCRKKLCVQKRLLRIFHLIRYITRKHSPFINKPNSWFEFTQIKRKSENIKQSCRFTLTYL